MPSAEVQNMIPKIQAYLATQPVEYAYLFGSCSRGEETRKSDVDILVKLSPTTPIGLFQYVGIMNDLEDIIGRKVDLVQEEGLADFARPSVNHDKIKIYERAEQRP